MAGRNNWLLGCGIGCLAVIVISVLGGVLLFNTGKKVVARFEELGDTQRTLADRFGEVADYVPPADGVLPAERVEIFLRVQDTLQETGRELVDHGRALQDLERQKGKGIGPGGILRGIRGVVGIGRYAAEYLQERNEALLAAEMGLGEYTYLYVLGYHSWLGRSFDPTFGEPSTRVDTDHGARIEIGDRDDERRAERLQDLFRGWAANQHQAAIAAGLDAAWCERLAAEVAAAAAADSLRLPWAGELPPALATGLDPFRSRFEATYLPLDPLVGVGVERDHNGEGFDFNIE
ncbi:MAG: hypothetical protein Q7W56_12420 [Candidatus Latescibacteria bacterium]|nr:hypothetical protein [Candidatus Latescibacterota bacterium]